MYAMLATWEHSPNEDSPPNIPVDDLSDTPTLKTALARPKKDKWIDVIHSELNNIKEQEVYELVDPKEENISNILGNKIVLHQKRGVTGKIKHYKA